MLTRICVALWIAMAGSASALSYQEKIIPLIARLVGVTADKKLAYTDAFLAYSYTSGYDTAGVFHIADLKNFSKNLFYYKSNIQYERRDTRE